MAAQVDIGRCSSGPANTQRERGHAEYGRERETAKTGPPHLLMAARRPGPPNRWVQADLSPGPLFRPCLHSLTLLQVSRCVCRASLHAMPLATHSNRDATTAEAPRAPETAVASRAVSLRRCLLLAAARPLQRRLGRDAPRAGCSSAHRSCRRGLVRVRAIENRRGTESLTRGNGRGPAQQLRQWPTTAADPADPAVRDPRR